MTTVKESDLDDSETVERNRAEPEVSDEPGEAKSVRQRRLSISHRSLVTAVVLVALVGAVGVLSWLYTGARNKLDVQERQSQDHARAEQIASNYALNAAEIDFQDLNVWRAKLVAGTGPELKEKLTKAGQEMEQIFVPLEWTSTARPLAAKVRSAVAGTYVVDCFVNVATKTVQGPEPLQSTATYSVTIDSGHDWQISDVGGIGAVADHK